MTRALKSVPLCEFRFEFMLDYEVSTNERGKMTVYLQNRRVLTHSERRLIKEFFCFLSAKGSHPTEDMPDAQDGKLAIRLLYQLIDYCLGKLGE